MGIRADGFAETGAKLQALAGDLAPTVDAALADLAGVGAKAARARIRSRTGALAATVDGRVVAGQALVSVGGPRAPYAAPVNSGVPARHMAGRRFLQAGQDAITAHLDTLDTAIAQAITQRGL